MAGAAAVTGGTDIATRLGRTLAALCAGLACAWLAGFVWFIVSATRTPAPLPKADGIVVLTGGADRVATALQRGQARVLLISGVGAGASLGIRARDSDVQTAGMEAAITLGRRATTTLGNAAETADWARRAGLRSLIVVTAFYHMPRALIELGRALPGVTLHPAPVSPPSLWQSPAASLRLLAGEYAKYVAAAAGLSALAHGPGTA
jgi:uncharacterized SAM-binding protein YcdF (DUF218 family)